MGVKVPATFEDSSGTIARLTGELEFDLPATTGEVLTVASPPSTASFQPGGASTEREQIAGNAVTITDGSTSKLTWDTKSSGTALLDLTDPANPTVVTAGVYAVTVQCQVGSLTTAGSYQLVLELDVSGDDPSCANTSSASNAGDPSPTVSCTLVYYVPAGGVLNASVTNNDGASSQQFTLSASVQAL